MLSAKRAVLVLGAILLGVTGVFGVTAWHEGYRIYIVHTGSMVPTFRPGDAVLDGPAPTSVRPGEVVTFSVHSGPDSVVTHRVASFSNGIVHTKGDANQTVDPWTLHLSQVVGTAAAILPKAGYALVYLKQPAGVASILTVAFGLVLLWQVFFPAEAAMAERRSQADGAECPSPRRVLVPAARHRRGPDRNRRKVPGRHVATKRASAA